jgi:hypothetical protein
MPGLTRTDPPGRDDSILTGDYASGLFEQFVEAVARREGEVLDLGPTTGDNIVFWGRRGFRVTAIDLLSRPQRVAAIELGEDRFVGVQCWNVFSALTPEDASLLAAKIRRALRPGALAFAIFDGDGRHKPPALRYRVSGPGRLAFEPLKGDVDMRAIPTSEIESLFRGFRPTRLTVMRHGSREALTHFPGGRHSEERDT